MSTSLVPGPRRARGRTIVAALALLALALPLGAQARAGKGAERPRAGTAGPAERRARLAERAGKAPAAAPERAAPESAPSGAPSAPAARSTKPTSALTTAPGPARVPEAESARRARAAQSAWLGITDGLRREYYARHPEAAFADGWPEARALGLGALGDGSGLRWRAALLHARGELAQLDLDDAPRGARASAAALADWVEAELLRLDTQGLPIRDAAGYVQQALRTLAAAGAAVGLAPEERRAAELGLVAQLPAWLRSARAALLAPAPAWIELALDDLDDLEERVARLVPPPPPGPKAGPGRRSAPAAPVPEPLRALEDFRAWLLGERAGAGSRPPTLDASEWARLVRLTTGTPWEPGEIKARALRELAGIEPPAEDRPAPRARASDPARLVRSLRAGSARALRIGRKARLLRVRPGARSIEFTSAESARTGLELAVLRPGAAGTLEVVLQLAHRAWPAAYAAAREQELAGSQLTALGIRHGLAGEGLLELARRASNDPLARLPVNLVTRAAIGLFAQDWIGRVSWVENALGASARVRRALERQRALEAARLLAALELHAEGISLAEVALAFQRRTGARAEVALAEALRAERDPLHGLGFLGLLELRALEQRLAARSTPRRGLATALHLVLQGCALRPSDLGGGAGRGARAAR